MGLVYLTDSLGIEADDRRIVDTRLTIISEFLAKNFGDGVQHWATHFAELERRVTQSESTDPIARRNGRTRWRDSYLIPLALSLGLVQRVEQQTVARCLRRGLFDRRSNNSKRLQRPSLDNLLPQALAVVAEHQYGTHRVVALVEQGICRDELTAKAVAAEFKRSGDLASNLARGLILAFFAHGPVGLLMCSECSYADELLLLQRYSLEIAQICGHPEITMATLRADIIALYKALHSIDASLWQQHLLHEPPGSATRRRYKLQLTQSLQEAITKEVASQCKCNHAEALILVATLFANGLPGLINWRCSVEPTTSQYMLAREQIRRVLNEHLSALLSDAYQEVERLLMCLHVSIADTNFSLALSSLLQDHPSSSARVRIGRRLWFGVAATSRRRQRRNRKQRGIVQFPYKRSLRSKVTFVGAVAPEDRFVSAFARLAGLESSDARHRLRDLITYGAFGMLSKGARLSAIDPHMVAYLHLIKLGRLDGTIDWARLLTQASNYAQMIESPSLSPQILRAIFNGLPKPRRWHGGEGEAVAKVRQRATLMLVSTPRLHRIWMAIPIKLRLCLVDALGSWIGNTLHVLLIADREAELPVGCWSGASEIQGQDIGLGLYQAIWHPGALNAALRGLPEIIQIPTSLDGEGLNDVRHAITMLGSEIEEIDDKAWSKIEGIQSLVQQIRIYAPDQIGKLVGMDRMTCQQAHDALLKWMGTHFFPNHRVAEVPLSIRQFGVVMPAYDSPIAGRLLAPSGIVTTVRDGVVDRGLFYTNSRFRSEPGLVLQKRVYPYVYHDTEAALFVEQDSRQGTILNYVIRSDELYGGAQ